MTRQWYVVYTRPLKEKKLVSFLTKKRIENLCPLVKAYDNKSTVKRDEFIPLFNSYVFVYLLESEINTVKKLPGIVSVIYWKTKPAIISEKEIDIIRLITSTYSTITLEKSAVNMDALVNIVGEPELVFKENSVSLKYQSIKINLPSLGYNMIAERIKLTEEVVYQQIQTTQPGLLNLLPRRLNALLF